MADEPKTAATPKSARGPVVSKETGADAAKAIGDAEDSIDAPHGELVLVRAVGSRPRRRADRKFDHVQGTVLDVSELSRAEAKAIRSDPVLHVTPHTPDAE